MRRGEPAPAKRGLLSRLFGRAPAPAPSVPDWPVFSLDHPHDLDPAALRALLGGKGAGLNEMRLHLDLPVPPGFVLATTICGEVAGGGWPEGLSAAIAHRLQSLEQETGRRLGAAERPLFVSVRSGAAVSMPGMMDTVLNLGANQASIDALAQESGDRQFAFDIWSRFCRIYAATVLGIGADEIGPEPAKDEPALKADVEAVRSLCTARGTPIPDDPIKQLEAAIAAVFRSSCSERARVFRAREGIAGDVATAATVQAMVFGNLGRRSGTGVAFSRNPSTGAPAPYGDFLLGAQGEDVVSGGHLCEPLESMGAHLPEAHGALQDILSRLERHYRDLCDVEFTVQEGTLHILQVRPGKRSAEAAVRIAVDMAEDPDMALDRREALARISPEQVAALRDSATVDQNAEPVATGIPASPGVVSGVICTDPDRVSEQAESGNSVILVRPETSPADVHGMVRAAGIVTATGGMVSHAALVARGWSIAAVCGVPDLSFEPGLSLSGTTLKQGDVITIDGGTGTIYLGDVVAEGAGEPEALLTLRQWAADLGIAFGESGDGLHAPATGTPDLPGAFDLLRALALLGIGTVERLAAALVTAPEAVQQALDELEPGLVSASPRGLMLTPEGKNWLAARLDAERAGVDPATFETLYQRFMVLDAAFKQIVTDWQVREADGVQQPNDHTDSAYDAAVLQRLNGLHEDNAALATEAAGPITRLTAYGTRFNSAIEAIRGGDGSMIASPLKDSYHTVWFEFHEELIHLSGRDRAEEEQKHG